MSAGYPWGQLGIAPTSDAKAIRGAYAARIKTMDLDADVEGYAQLRRARDAALRMAKSMAQPDSAPAGIADAENAAPIDTPVADDITEPPAQWLHAAPTLADNPGEAEHPAPSLTARPAPDDDARLLASLSDGFTAQAPADPGQGIVPPGADPFAPPRIEGHDDAPAVGMEALQSPFARLAALLDPEGPAGTAPLDDVAEAQALLGAVLEAIHWSPIAQQGEMEGWLAGLLAQAWPRSAPLLDEATAAFGWEQEWGRLDARPAIEYLGARLRGYRFQRKVAQPDHRYHKAWQELTRPGRAGPLRFLRTSSADVRGLLAGIRKHFPELEDHFDPQRVNSWEEASAWPTALIVLGGLIVLGVLLSLGDSNRSTRTADTAQTTAPIATEPSAAEESRRKEAEDAGRLDPVVAETFGAGRDLDWLRANVPDLAWTIVNFDHNRRVTTGNEAATQADGTTVHKAIEETRRLVYLVGRQQTGKDFDRTMRLKLDLLKAARVQGAAPCAAYVQSGMLAGSVPVPAGVRDRERDLAASLADRGLLGSRQSSGPRRASVPGPLVEKVMSATGLSEQRVGTAMGGKGSDADRCAVSIALLQATLGWKGEGRRDILMTL